jgi:hypothetical protein
LLPWHFARSSMRCRKPQLCYVTCVVPRSNRTRSWTRNERARLRVAEKSYPTLGPRGDWSWGTRDRGGTPLSKGGMR